MKMHQAVAICLVLIALQVVFLPKCSAADAFEARSVINEAELNLNSAIEMVVEAEEAGADIEGLLPQISTAISFLSEAYQAFRVQDYETTISLALECNNTIASFATEADYLMLKAERMKTDMLLFNSFWSIIGLLLLVVFSIIGWRILKERLLEKVLEMKPKVDDTS